MLLQDPFKEIRTVRKEDPFAEIRKPIPTSVPISITAPAVSVPSEKPAVDLDTTVPLAEKFQEKAHKYAKEIPREYYFEKFKDHPYLGTAIVSLIDLAPTTPVEASEWYLAGKTLRGIGVAGRWGLKKAGKLEGWLEFWHKQRHLIPPEIWDNVNNEVKKLVSQVRNNEIGPKEVTETINKIADRVGNKIAKVEETYLPKMRRERLLKIPEKELPKKPLMQTLKEEGVPEGNIQELMDFNMLHPEQMLNKEQYLRKLEVYGFEPERIQRVKTLMEPSPEGIVKAKQTGLHETPGEKTAVSIGKAKAVLEVPKPTGKKAALGYIAGLNEPEKNYALWYLDAILKEKPPNQLYREAPKISKEELPFKNIKKIENTIDKFFKETPKAKPLIKVEVPPEDLAEHQQIMAKLKKAEVKPIPEPERISMDIKAEIETAVAEKRPPDIKKAVKESPRKLRAKLREQWIENRLKEMKDEIVSGEPGKRYFNEATGEWTGYKSSHSKWYTEGGFGAIGKKRNLMALETRKGPVYEKLYQQAARDVDCGYDNIGGHVPPIDILSDTEVKSLMKLYSGFPFFELWEKQIGTPVVEALKSISRKVFPKRIQRALVYKGGLPTEYQAWTENAVRGLTIGQYQAEEIATQLTKKYVKGKWVDLTHAEKLRLDRLLHGGVVPKGEKPGLEYIKSKDWPRDVREIMDILGLETKNLGLWSKPSAKATAKEILKHRRQPLNKRQRQTLFRRKAELQGRLADLDPSSKEAKAIKEEILTIANTDPEKGIIGYIPYSYKGEQFYGPLMYLEKEAPELAKALSPYMKTKPMRIPISRFLRRKGTPEQPLGTRIAEPAYPFSEAVRELTKATEYANLFKNVAENPEFTKTAEQILKLAPEEAEKYTLLSLGGKAGKKIGELNDKYVLKEIAKDIEEVTSIPSEAYRTYLKYLLGPWKYSKAVASSATQSRNQLANMILADWIGDVPLHRTDLWLRSGYEILKAVRARPVKIANDYTQLKEMGFLGQEFAKEELLNVLTILNEAPGKSMITKVANLLKKTAKAPGKTYQIIEQLAKVTVFKRQKALGKSPYEAARIAEKAIFNYGKVPWLIKWARTSPIGSAFISFPYFAIPRLFEAGIKKPWKPIKYILMFGLMEEVARNQLGESDQEFEDERELLPDYMKGKPMGIHNWVKLPFLDKYWQTGYVNMTFILPWGDIGEVKGESLLQKHLHIPRVLSPQNPVFSIMASLVSNINLFTGKEIVKPGSTEFEAYQQLFDHVYKELMPSISPALPELTEGGYSWQKVEKALKEEAYFEEAPSIPGALAGTVLGLKIRAVNIERERAFRIIEKRQLIDKLKKQIRSITLNRANRDEMGNLKPEANNEIEGIKNKIKGIADEIRHIKTLKPKIHKPKPEITQ